MTRHEALLEASRALDHPVLDDDVVTPQDKFVCWRNAVERDKIGVAEVTQPIANSGAVGRRCRRVHKSAQNDVFSIVAVRGSEHLRT